MLCRFHLAPILLLTLASLCVHADDESEPAPQWYSIEYIVFENNPLGQQAVEPWTKEPFLMPDNSIILDNELEGKTFSSLAIDQQQLHGVFNRLEKLSSYTPILHGGWIQPVKEKAPLEPIQIIHQADALQLEGTLTFHRGRYLHLDINLQLSEVTNTDFNDNFLTSSFIQAPTLYRLKETRRVKTTDTHFFDHPRFGVLAVIEKIDSPEAAVSTADLLEEPQIIEALETLEPSLPVKENEN